MQRIVEKEWTYRGYDCLIACMFLGHRCGYVRIPRDHPHFGRNYEGWPDIDVHGGLTFSSALPEREGYWIGFDCAHCFDLRDPEICNKFIDIANEISEEEGGEALKFYTNFSPGDLFERLCPDNGMTWTLDLVIAETENLVDQVKEMEVKDDDKK